LGRARLGSIEHLFEEDEEAEDHGMMRLREGRRWREGFMVITDRRLIFYAAGLELSIPYGEIFGHRGFRKIATADVFIDASINGRPVRMRFNGGKTFAFLVCRAIADRR